MNNLWFGMSPKDSIQQPRIHSQLIPHNAFAETRMPLEIIQALTAKGHNVSLVVTIKSTFNQCWCIYLFVRQESLTLLFIKGILIGLAGFWSMNPDQHSCVRFVL